MAILGLLWHQAPHVGLGGEHVGDLGEEGGAHQQAESVRLKGEIRILHAAQIS